MTHSGPTFLGLGVEKAATSWIFSCLYEHPEICIPVKEINFFSNDNKWNLGTSWYQDFFNERCNNDVKAAGEYSTEYFHDPQAITRIQSAYPDSKLIVCLRDPIHRAYSQYRNDIMAETLNRDVTFEDALGQNDSYICKGLYKNHLEVIRQYFALEQLLILIYEDIEKDSLGFIQAIYRHIGVDDTFVPQNLMNKINVSRVPKILYLEKKMNILAEKWARNSTLNKYWWCIKQSGLARYIRNINTDKTNTVFEIDVQVRNKLFDTFIHHKEYVDGIVNRRLPWLNDDQS